LEDFPFRAWIGCTCESDEEASLLFKPGRSAASLAGIRIECARCAVGSSMAGAFREGALLTKGIDCSDGQPWLGRVEGKEACGFPLATVQRGASNVYFA